MEKEDMRLVDATINDLVARVTIELNKVRPKEPLRFITEDEARKMLHCGKTFITQLRNSGKIAFVQDIDHKKLITYDRLSILKYQESNLHKTF